MEFGTRLKEIADKMTVALDQLIPPAGGPEANLMRAMRHAALANGKRMRPFFVLETGAMFRADETSLLRVAAALECIHTYSLVHSHLPAMGNDDYRHGQPTVHRAFDEATAVLAGDGLLTLAFRILADEDTHPDGDIRARLIERLADASGARGMVGGQMIAMLTSAEAHDLNTITRMQRLKTGALISYSTEAAALVANARDSERQALVGFSHDLGLAYQIADDLLNFAEVTATNIDGGMIGKGSFVTLLGVDGAQQRVRLLAAQAKEHLSIFGDRANILLQSVDYVLERRA